MLWGNKTCVFYYVQGVSGRNSQTWAIRSWKLTSKQFQSYEPWRVYLTVWGVCKQFKEPIEQFSNSDSIIFFYFFTFMFLDVPYNIIESVYLIFLVQEDCIINFKLYCKFWSIMHTKNVYHKFEVHDTSSV